MPHLEPHQLVGHVVDQLLLGLHNLAGLLVGHVDEGAHLDARKGQRDVLLQKMQWVMAAEDTR